MQLNKVSVDDINVKGKKVLVRVDFNVPLKDGVITNDNRIVAALPTIKKLIADGGKVILCSHLGKPKNGPEEKFSLAPAAVRLSELLGQEVVFANDDEVVGENAKKAVAEMKDGDVVLLQNTRFRKEETKNLEPFSSELASLADVFVMDAFGSAHRAHCSTAGVTEHIKDTAVGYLMQKEINYLGNAVETPVRPFVAILVRLPSVPSSLSSAALRLRTSSTLSPTSSRSATHSSSAAVWLTPSSRLRAKRLATPSLTTASSTTARI